MNQQAEPARECRQVTRRIVLAAVALHLLAVLAEPLAFFSRSDFQVAPEFFGLRRAFAPYVEWMYLDHGYFFFAPNPGPSHLIAVQEKNSEPNSPRRIHSDALIYPDRKSHWPRLLYHRYFMLSEFYNNSFAPTEITEQDKTDRMFAERWESDRRFYESLQRSISKSRSVRHGLDGLDGLDPDRIELLRIERPLPSPEQIHRMGRRLGDSRDLILLPEGLDTLVPPSLSGVP